MRISRDEMFMKIAHIVAQRGTCPRARVGAVLVDHRGKIRSIGYNGNPTGMPHCEDVGCRMEDGHCTATHAEINAIQHWPVRDDGTYTLYVTHKPCEHCIKAIVNSEIGHVVYDIFYRYDGPESFTEGGVTFEQYKGPGMSEL